MASERGGRNTPTIDLEEAKRYHDFGTAVFVDVRRRSAYDRSHVRGAVSIPLVDLAHRLEELPRGGLIIFY